MLAQYTYIYLINATVYQYDSALSFFQNPRYLGTDLHKMSQAAAHSIDHPSFMYEFQPLKTTPI